MNTYKPKGPIGTGARFKRLSDVLGKKPGVTNPDALDASIGHNKFGTDKFKKMAAKGKK